MYSGNTFRLNLPCKETCPPKPSGTIEFWYVWREAGYGERPFSWRISHQANSNRFCSLPHISASTVMMVRKWKVIIVSCRDCGSNAFKSCPGDRAAQDVGSGERGESPVV